MNFPYTNLPWLWESVLFLTRHGSQAYGTNVEGSDEDFKGFSIPPQPYFLGFCGRFEQAEFKKPDMVIYDIRKFFRLAADCNPSIIEVLFTQERDHRLVTDLGRMVLEKRDLFLSRKAMYTFSGYATSQMKKIKAQQQWLKDPSSAPAGWLENRNEKRRELDIKYGYDTKHGMHLVRLMRMGQEILDGKGVQVFRPDREELLAIRKGAWKFDELIEWTLKSQEKLDSSYKTSKIPHSVDMQELDKLCVSCVESFQAWGGPNKP